MDDYDLTSDIAVSKIHEAGHAVAAHLLGAKVTSVEVWNVGGGVVSHKKLANGRLRFAPLTARRSVFALRAIISVAGPVAELRVRRPSPHRWRERSDVEKMHNLAEKLGLADEADSLIGRAVVEASAMLRDPVVWSALRSLASALRPHEPLDGDEVARIVDAALGLARPPRPSRDRHARA